jgi:hypothetical protein
MSTRLISVAIAVDAKVELFTTEDKTFIQRRKQHILSSSQFLYRYSEQPVISPCVASHN